MKRLALLFAAGLMVVGVGITMKPAGAIAPCDSGPNSTKPYYSTLGLGTTTGGAFSFGSGDTGTIYIDDRDYISQGPESPVLSSEGGGLWLYLESNGVHGLQRGGTAPVDPLGTAGLSDPDTDGCNDGGTPDTLIF